MGLLSQFLGSVVTIVFGVALTAWLYRKAGGDGTREDSFLVTAIIALVASLIAGILILIGLVFLVLPGIWLAVRLRLVVPVVVVEGAGPLEAISRSLSITERHTWTVFGVAAALFAVNVAILAAVAYHFGVFGAGPLEESTLRLAVRTGSVVTTTLISPVSIAADVVMYGVFLRNTGIGREGDSPTGSGTALA